jgi:hypothetical protein
MTRVINIKNAPRDWENNRNYAYIGRCKGCKWGNPIFLTSEKYRKFVYNLYKKWLMRQPFKYREEMVAQLSGKTLVCFCKPKMCHGDAIVEYINSGYEEELRQLSKS